jgi:prepilin-type N-terminal cleavage/methylation domain-containing protein
MRRMSVPLGMLFCSRVRYRKAMTFIELLIVVAVMSVVSLAIYNAFSRGIEIWQRSQRVVREEDVVIFFDKVNGDAHAIVPFAAFPFEGSQTRVSFPAMVLAVADPLTTEAGEHVEQIGKVEYSFSPDEHVLIRRQADYGQACAGAWDPSRVLVKDVSSVTFAYLYATTTGEVVSDHALEASPSYLEVTVTFDEGGVVQKMQKIIPVFVSG